MLLGLNRCNIEVLVREKRGECDFQDMMSNREVDDRTTAFFFCSYPVSPMLCESECHRLSIFVVRRHVWSNKQSSGQIGTEVRKH